MDLTDLDDALLLGDAAEAAVPPPLLTTAPVMDLSFHPQLPILAVGLVTGEIEVFGYTAQETTKKPLQNDFSSWIFGPRTRRDDVALNEHHHNLLVHPQGGVSALEFTDDGTYLVSGSSDRTLSVVDCVAERLVIHLPAGRLESATQAKRRLNARNAKHPMEGPRTPARPRHRVGENNPHICGISSLNVCDDNMVATGDDDGLVALWDMRARAPAHVYHEHGDYVSQLCYFTDVQELVSSSGDTCLGVYDVRGGKVRDFSERRTSELSCFAFINSSGTNSGSFIPSILCGTPCGSLPLWKYGSWRRPYDMLEFHPKECDALISFHGEDTTFNHNIVLTGACDGLVRVLQMYPLRRNLCQLSARDYTYAHAHGLGGKEGGASTHRASNYLIQRRRGHEAISRMRVSHDSTMLAVSGTDNIIDFVDVRFLKDEKELDRLRGRAERRHMDTLRTMERDAARRAEAERQEEEEDEEDEEEETDSDSSSESGADADGDAASKASLSAPPRRPARATREGRPDDRPRAKRAREVEAPERPSSAQAGQRTGGKGSPSGGGAPEASSPATGTPDFMEDYKKDRAKKREQVAATKWLKEEKRKKINFTFEKRRRRVGGFFGDLVQ